MRFTQDFIDKVREANSIGELIGQYTELKGGGHRLMGRCPFPDHSDKSPSFSVTEDNQLYYCYGCKKGGNVFTFLETFNGLSFPEAVEYLARRASIPLPEPDEKFKKRSGPTADQKDTLLKVNKASAVFFHHQLKTQAPESIAKSYLVKRGLDDEIVEKFRLGLALDDWQGLVKHFNQRKIPLALGETLGLFKPKKNARKDDPRGDSHFDLFRDRLMFPIFSPSGDVIGFGGRTLGDGLPKYVNSSDSPVFHKSKVLYGLHETGKYIRAEDQAIVVEGYMDAISLYAAGVKNVVAILGTAFTPEHAKLIKRYTLNVTMLLDGDEAGITGAERSLPVLLEAGLMPKGMVLPDKMDPDDFVKQKGVEVLREEIGRAGELFNVLLTRRWMNNYRGTPSDKVRVVEEAAIAMKSMQNRQLFELYVLELSRQLDIDINWIRRAFQQAAKPSTAPAPAVRAPLVSDAKPIEPQAEDLESSPDPEDVPIEKLELKGAPKDEAFVLSLLLHREALLREFMDAGDEGLSIFSHEGVKRLLKLAVQQFRAKPDHFGNLAADLATWVDLPALLASALPIVEGGGPEGFERRLLSDYIQSLRNRALKRQGKAMVNQLREGASPEAMAQFMNIQRTRLGKE